jgi:hypothetical protein
MVNVSEGEVAVICFQALGLMDAPEFTDGEGVVLNVTLGVQDTQTSMLSK